LPHADSAILITITPRNLKRVVGRAIVANDQFEIAEGLPQNRLDRLWEKPAVVKRVEANRDFRGFRDHARSESCPDNAVGSIWFRIMTKPALLLLALEKA